MEGAHKRACMMDLVLGTVFALRDTLPQAQIAPRLTTALQIMAVAVRIAFTTALVSRTAAAISVTLVQAVHVLRSTAACHQMAAAHIFASMMDPEFLIALVMRDTLSLVMHACRLTTAPRKIMAAIRYVSMMGLGLLTAHAIRGISFQGNRAHQSTIVSILMVDAPNCVLTTDRASVIVLVTLVIRYLGMFAQLSIIAQ